LEQTAEENICIEERQVTGRWRKVRDKELVLFFTYKIKELKENEIVKGCSTNGVLKAYRISVRKPNGRGHQMTKTCVGE
jgi:hypothetical protein